MGHDDHKKAFGCKTFAPINAVFVLNVVEVRVELSDLNKCVERKRHMDYLCWVYDWYLACNC